MPAKTKRITVRVNETKPEPLEVLAASIIEVAAAYKKLDQSRLKRRVVVLLIKDLTQNNVSITDIERVLDAVPLIADKYIKA
jgi:hypothetical protein